jgi:hypothetical protein
MVTDDLTPHVEELGLRSLEGPDKRVCVVGVGFTGVDLVALGPELEEQH